MKYRYIGKISNTYGGLVVKVEDDKFYWAIEDWDGVVWEEIPQNLYDELNRYQDTKDIGT